MVTVNFASWASVAVLCSSLFWAGWFSRRWWERRTRARRRGGYVGRVPVSVSWNQQTGDTVATFTGCSTDGQSPEVVAARLRLHEPSKTGARIRYGFATTGSRGGDEPLTTAPEGYGSWLEDGAQTELHPWGWSRKVPPA